MIPNFWLETLVNVYATVVTAFITGGNPVLGICDDHLHYGIQYNRE